MKYYLSVFILTVVFASCKKKNNSSTNQAVKFEAVINENPIIFEDAYVLIQKRERSDFKQIIADYDSLNHGIVSFSIAFSGDLSTRNDFKLIGITYYEKSYSESWSCQTCFGSDVLTITHNSPAGKTGYASDFTVENDSTSLEIKNLNFTNLPTEVVDLR